jgi:hypothetical protein
MMKISLILHTFSILIVSLSNVNGFLLLTPSAVQRTSLNLFGGGGGGKDSGGQPQQPGMMDQLAMFKKAQEIATKKRKLDEELQKTVYEGISTNENVKVMMKYVPVTNPMDPNPEYEPIQFIFDNDDYYNTVPVTDLSQDIQSALMNGIETINQRVAEKYATLQADLMEVLGGKMPGLM